MKPFATTTALALALATAAIPPATAAEASPDAASVRHDTLTLPPPKPGHARPLIAVIADAAGAETADFVVPLGVLRASGLAEVRALSTASGPVQLYHAIRIQPDQTTAAFDRAAPEGADIVIVPAQMRPDSPALVGWVRAQAAKGATIVAICEGARVMAAADLVRGQQVTTHWHALKALQKEHPEARWVRDRRYVEDGRIISTAGVSAALPASLALVEAIGGPGAARAEADRLGVRTWSAAHRTGDFGLGAGDYLRIAAGFLAFWTHETVEAPVTNGADEIALALRTDAWARSLRARVVTTRPGRQPIRSRHGLVILPDAEPSSGRYVLQAADRGPGDQLKVTLAAMARRYGPGVAHIATMTLEAEPSETR